MVVMSRRHPATDASCPGRPGSATSTPSALPGGGAAGAGVRSAARARLTQASRRVVEPAAARPRRWPGGPARRRTGGDPVGRGPQRPGAADGPTGAARRRGSSRSMPRPGRRASTSGRRAAAGRRRRRGWRATTGASTGPAPGPDGAGAPRCPGPVRPGTARRRARPAAATRRMPHLDCDSRGKPDGRAWATSWSQRRCQAPSSAVSSPTGGGRWPDARSASVTVSRTDRRLARVATHMVCSAAASPG